MKIKIIRQGATEKDLQEMLEELETYVKLAVDVKRAFLQEAGSIMPIVKRCYWKMGAGRKTSGCADWYPKSRTVQFVALINIRPRQGNRGMEIEDRKLREKMEAIVRGLLEVKFK